MWEKQSVYFSFAHGRISCHTLRVPSRTHQMACVWDCVSPACGVLQPLQLVLGCGSGTHLPKLVFVVPPLELIIVEPFRSLKRGALLSGPNYSLDNYFRSLPSSLFLIDSKAILVMIIIDAQGFSLQILCFLSIIHIMYSEYWLVFYLSFQKWSK